MEHSKQEYLKKIIANKKNLIIIGVVVIVVIGGIVLGLKKSQKQYPNCKPAGTAVEKSYGDQPLSIDEWSSYNDQEVKFFIGEEAQKFISEKIDALRGYGGIAYNGTTEAITIDKGYYGKGCQPLRYKYDMIIRASLSGKDLSATLFGRWYYKDIYKITALYNSESKKWESFDTKLEEAKLVPGSAIENALSILKSSSGFQQIEKEGYQISELYWQPKGQGSENDILVLIYSKPVENENNCLNYYTVKIDTLANGIISENQEKKCN